MEIEYGKEKIQLPIKDEQIQSIIEPKWEPIIADFPRTIEDSFQYPIKNLPLGEIKLEVRTALIVIGDSSYPSPAYIIQPLVTHLQRRGIRVDIMLAIGSHRFMEQSEIIQHIGSNLAESCYLFQHESMNDGQHKDLGISPRGTHYFINRLAFDYDLVLSAEIIEPIFPFGFSGGGTIILPGIAHQQTIRANYFLGIGGQARIGKLKGNPVSDEVAYIAKKVSGYSWATYVVVDAYNQPLHIVSGDPFAAHSEACKLSRDIYTCPLTHGDVVIASPGPYPHSRDLSEASRAMVAATDAVNQDGIIILLAECPESFGSDPVCKELLTSKQPKEILERGHNLEAFSPGVLDAFLFAKPAVDKNVTIILVTNEKLCQDLQGSFIRATASLEQAIHWAEALKRDSKFLVLRHARRLILEAETRVPKPILRRG